MVFVVPQERLVRKEASLGAIRALPYPEDHIGLRTIAPWLDVETDDVIFEYLDGGLSAGLAPARAEDAEAELAQKDELSYGDGRASLIDWSLKDRYTTSDVTRYREDALLRQLAQGSISGVSAIPLTFAGRAADGFEAKLARHDKLRRRKLDNRLEWLIMRGLEAGEIVYDDGRIKFRVNYGRPVDQTAQPVTVLWDNPACDPIGDILAATKVVYDRTGVRPTRGIISEKILNNFWKSEKFLASAGIPIVGGSPSSPLDVRYLGLQGYNRAGALRIVEEATGVRFTIYDSVYRTRAIGSKVFVNNRFTSDHRVILMPNVGDGAGGGIDSTDDGLSTNGPFSLGDIDDTEIGFAKTLTSPHVAGNWTSGYYEWEAEQIDPWQHVRGTGVKAFPVFPYLEYTYTMDVLAPS